MSAVASSAPALDLYGVPLGSLLTNGAGVAAPGNIVGVAGVLSNPLYVTKIPKAGYYRFVLNGYVNGTNTPGVTGITFFFYSDVAATVKIGDITLAFPPAALIGQTYVAFSQQNIIYVPESELLTMRVVVSGSSSTIYNSLPNAAAANQGLALYWQPI
jgi:hypothetical protein